MYDKNVGNKLNTVTPKLMSSIFSELTKRKDVDIINHLRIGNKDNNNSFLKNAHRPFPPMCNPRDRNWTLIQYKDDILPVKQYVIAILGNAAKASVCTAEIK